MPGTAVVRRPTEETALRDLRPARISPARFIRLLTAARATADRHGQLLFSRALDRAHGPQDDACPICGYWTCRCGRGATALTDAERQEPSRRNAEKNRESENRPG